MDFFAVACWAWPFTTRHGGIQRQRLSSSTILRWVSGDREYRERYNAVREKLTPFGLFAPDLPEAFPAGPDDVFLWSHWSDAMQRFYDVDGVPLSPFEMEVRTPEWDAFKDTFPMLPKRTVDEVRSDWLAVDEIMDDRGVACGVVTQTSRVGAPEAEWVHRLLRFEVEIMHTLVPRGWRAFPFPHDAPPSNDEYFAPYQREWLVRFVARCVATLRGR